jgi:hypothetical protein
MDNRIEKGAKCGTGPERWNIDCFKQHCSNDRQSIGSSDTQRTGAAQNTPWTINDIVSRTNKQVVNHFRILAPICKWGEPTSAKVTQAFRYNSLPSRGSISKHGLVAGWYPLQSQSNAVCFVRYRNIAGRGYWYNATFTATQIRMDYGKTSTEFLTVTGFRGPSMHQGQEQSADTTTLAPTKQVARNSILGRLRKR